MLVYNVRNATHAILLALLMVLSGVSALYADDSREFAYSSALNHFFQGGPALRQAWAGSNGMVVKQFSRSTAVRANATGVVLTEELLANSVPDTTSEDALPPWIRRLRYVELTGGISILEALPTVILERVTHVHWRLLPGGPSDRDIAFLSDNLPALRGLGLSYERRPQLEFGREFQQFKKLYEALGAKRQIREVSLHQLPASHAEMISEWLNSIAGLRALGLHSVCAAFLHREYLKEHGAELEWLSVVYPDGFDLGEVLNSARHLKSLRHLAFSTGGFEAIGMFPLLKQFHTLEALHTRVGHNLREPITPEHVQVINSTLEALVRLRHLSYPLEVDYRTDEFIRPGGLRQLRSLGISEAGESVAPWLRSLVQLVDLVLINHTASTSRRVLQSLHEMKSLERLQLELNPSRVSSYAIGTLSDLRHFRIQFFELRPGNFSEGDQESLLRTLVQLRTLIIQGVPTMRSRSNGVTQYGSRPFLVPISSGILDALRRLEQLEVLIMDAVGTFKDIRALSAALPKLEALGFSSVLREGWVPDDVSEAPLGGNLRTITFSAIESAYYNTAWAAVGDVVLVPLALRR
jgi:hypothetical protein